MASATACDTRPTWTAMVLTTNHSTERPEFVSAVQLSGGARLSGADQPICTCEQLGKRPPLVTKPRVTARREPSPHRPDVDWRRQGAIRLPRFDCARRLSCAVRPFSGLRVSLLSLDFASKSGVRHIYMDAKLIHSFTELHTTGGRRFARRRCRANRARM